jgi:hypothetical protein
MKTSIMTSVIFFVLGAMSCSSSSDPEPELSEEEKQINKLAKTWTLGKVTYGDDDVTERFDGFELTMTKEKAYNTSGNRGDYDYEPFKSSGSWELHDDNINIISRDDGVEMGSQVTENELVLIFSISEENGRRAGLGNYRFDLVAQ